MLKANPIHNTPSNKNKYTHIQMHKPQTQDIHINLFSWMFVDIWAKSLRS